MRPAAKRSWSWARYPTRLQVVAQAAESDLNRVAVDQQAEVELPRSPPGSRRKSRASARGSIPNRAAPRCYFALAKQADGLRAGMMAQVALRAGGNIAIRLPVTAVVIKEGKRRVVYVEKADGSFEAREVKTGRNQDGWVIVLEGLARRRPGG